MEITEKGQEAGHLGNLIFRKKQSFLWQIANHTVGIWCWGRLLWEIIIFINQYLETIAWQNNCETLLLYALILKSIFVWISNGETNKQGTYLNTYCAEPSPARLDKICFVLISSWSHTFGVKFFPCIWPILNTRMGRTWELHTERTRAHMGFEPRAFLLWGNRRNDHNNPCSQNILQQCCDNTNVGLQLYYSKKRKYLRQKCTAAVIQPLTAPQA